MDFKSILSGQGKKEEEYFWALTIEPGWVQAAIWKIKEDKVEVISLSPPSAWELNEELIDAADTVLTSAVQTLPEDINEPRSTVFGVIPSWVSEGQIKEEYLEKIKSICTKLSLTPVGFVVLSEAIAHFLKTEEESPPNAVFLGVFKENIEISLFKLGNLVGNSQIARSVSVVDDVAEGLARFSGNQIPSRFILYNGKEGELEEVRQTLIKVNWEDFENISFLHTPKIEVIDPEKKINAVCLAGGSEISNAKGLVVQSSIKEEEIKEIENIKMPEKNVSPEELGFTLDEDITKTHPPETKEDQLEHVDKIQPTRVEDTPPVQENFEMESKPSISIGTKSNFLGKFKNFRGKAASLIGKVKISNFVTNQFGKTISWGILFFALVVVGGFLFWWFYPKANIVIFISPKHLEEKIPITVDSNISEPNISEKIIPGELVETSISGDKTKSTTGTKTVGEQARGEVTLFRVGSQLSLTSGTVIRGPSSLDFTLDEAVTLASGSASTPGTTKVKVTAKDIGAQYNLASGTSFSVSNYSTSDIEAKNDGAFSGGSSREINAVSEGDQTSLLSDLEDELKNKAKTELLGSVSSDKLFVEESIAATASASKYSSKVGDEATTLKLNLTLGVSALTVDKKALTSLAQEALKSEVPQGFVIREDQIDTTFNFEGQKNKVYQLDAFVKANLLPQVDPEKIAKDISGKYPQLAEEYFVREIPGFVRAEVKFNKPRLPGRLGTLPRVVKNIDVIVSSEE